jgi:phosphoribosylaminoimidazolecarboxamide formyltransferase / IMP cyclohydrolase
MMLMNNELSLRYGCNPHQIPARAYPRTDRLPFNVLNGSLGYINLLDALNSWQLVRELRDIAGDIAAASFKHVSPSGVALGLPLSETLRKAYRVEDLELSPAASAYARARGTDRLCSFGDWVAISDTVDVSLARLLQREVSDGIVACRYEPEALAILSKKKQGKYTILEMDEDYVAPELETRDVFGVAIQQRRNGIRLDAEVLRAVVTKNTDWPAAARRDALVALTTLKYTQSNSVCVGLDGQTIGVGAGQQSRIHCTRIACSKAETWYLRQHPACLDLKFKSEVKRPDRDNAVEQYLRDDLTAAELRLWKEVFSAAPPLLLREQRSDWLRGLRGAVLASDGYIPFRDSVDRAHKAGVAFVVQPGGSNRDAQVIDACNEYGMAMAHTGIRLFHH